jgi:hypothetical protein
LLGILWATWSVLALARETKKLKAETEANFANFMMISIESIIHGTILV